MGGAETTSSGFLERLSTQWRHSKLYSNGFITINLPACNHRDGLQVLSITPVLKPPHSPYYALYQFGGALLQLWSRSLLYLDVSIICCADPAPIDSWSYCFFCSDHRYRYADKKVSVNRYQTSTTRRSLCPLSLLQLEVIPSVTQAFLSGNYLFFFPFS